MRLGLSFLTFAVAAVMSVNSAFADIISTQGFADIGSPTVDTGDITTATVFNVGDYFTTASNTGLFAGMPTQNIGPVSFDITVPTSFSFSNAVFGDFVSTSISVISNGQTGSGAIVGLYILGNFTSGTYAPGINGEASMTVTFNQTSGGAISDSATFSIPPATVPEPSTVALATLGLCSIGVMASRRRVVAA